MGSPGRILTGTASGQLQLWTVGEAAAAASPPPVALADSMELDGSVFSSAFNRKTELVCRQIHTSPLSLPLLSSLPFLPPFPSPLLPPSLLPSPLLSPSIGNPYLPQGVVGTTAGSVWYVNWQDRSCVKLVSGHSDQVSVGGGGKGYGEWREGV